MATIKTPNDFGQAIREQRRALGWDQAKLAKQVGVSRQWVIDIEKGKPRAELELALRTLRVLGLTLTTTPKDQVVAPVSIGAPGRPGFDIDRIVGALPGTANASRLHEMFVMGLDGTVKRVEATSPYTMGHIPTVHHYEPIKAVPSRAVKKQPSTKRASKSSPSPKKGA